MRFDQGVELALNRTPNLVRHPVVKQHPVEVVVLVLKHLASKPSRVILNLPRRFRASTCTLVGL